MILPHLIFAHLLADYVLQTDWLANRKGQFIVREIHSWDGLLLHGLLLGLVTQAVLLRYIGALWPSVVLLALFHTLQDGLKVWLGPRVSLQPPVLYFLDQGLHLLILVIFQDLVANLVTPPPSSTEISLLALLASLVAVTRFYEVSWWANWRDMIAYMKRWQLWGYLERSTMFLLSAVNLWWLAPLAVIPRLYVSRHNGAPIWEQKRGLLELLLGIAFSVILGVVH